MPTKKLPTNPAWLALAAGAAFALAPSASAADAPAASVTSGAGSPAGGGGLVPAAVRPDATMLQFPDVHGDRIVFSYANDLWLAPKSGGVATRLASPPGPETFPRFSPDGKTIAFVGNYEGNRDLYTIPADGAGLATRVTHHPGNETLSDWTPDGKRLIFYTVGLGGLTRQQQLFTVDATGGLPVQLPVPYGTFASISPDGNWLAYTPHTTDFRTWKRYRGGMATDIWLLNLKDKTSKKATDFDGTDTAPMFDLSGGNTLYYLSDAGQNHLLNIWSFDPGTGKRNQVTTFDKFDCKWPSMGGPGQGEVVLQNGSGLHIVSLKTGAATPIDVVIPGDRPSLRARAVDYANFMGALDISGTGKRVVVEARGDLWSLPAKEGAATPLTRTDHLAERYPTLSPDGKSVAYMSDASGEYELYVMPLDGKGEPKQLTTSGQGGVPAAAWRYTGVFAPDSKSVTWTGKDGTLYLTTIESGETVKVATDQWANTPSHSFSSDSQWIALTLADENQQSAIWLYNIPEKKLTRVTESFFNCLSPAFDREGKYLYYTVDNKFQATYATIDSTFIYKDSTAIVCVPLRNDIDSPFAPKNDAEGEKKKDDKKDGEKKDEGKSDDAEKKDEAKPEGDAAEGDKKNDAEADKKDGEKKDDKKDEPKKPDPVKIDVDGFQARAIELPLPGGSYGSLMVADGGKLLFIAQNPIDPDADEPLRGGTLRMFDVSDEGKDGKRTAKTILEGVEGFALSGDGKKLLVRRGKEMAVIDPAPEQKFEKKVPTGQMKGQVEPRVEWNQIITDVERLFRDFFYVENMHGVDWPAQVARYRGMLADAVTRDDVNFVIRELISELNVGHAYLGNPGDIDPQPSTPTALLGADYELVSGTEGTAYRFKKIYTGAVWDTDAKGPLSQPGVKVKEGDFLLAVNGVPVDTSKDPWAAFVGISPGSTVALTVAAVPNMKGTPESDNAPRDIYVKAIGSGEEVGLRYRAWIERNRAYVDYKTGGKVGYCYVPNTGVDGQTDLFRQFYGQRDKEAMIIDERWNGGGQIPNRFIELLNRPRLNYWARRDGLDWPWPYDAHQGPKCMLVNGLAGSGGDCFPWYFQKLGLGKVIGKRTWGGLVGISGNPGLVDGGSVTVPTFGFYEKDGTWGVEGHGIDPDIVVEDDPALMQDGGDPQLDAAIAQMEKEMKERPYTAPKRPKAPDRKGMGLPDADR
ncbi:MAG: S41 family peptidase [Phycisphaerales bacterium]